MRYQLLFLLMWSFSQLDAAQITVGDTVLTIPKDELHAEISMNSPMLRMIRSVLPPEYRIQYAEAPLQKVGAVEAPLGPGSAMNYQLVISLAELDTESFSKEDFIELREELAEGLKEGLEEATEDESVDLVRRAVSQQTQSELLIEKPTLIGEPELTDEHVRFTMLTAMTLKEKRRILALRGTMRPIKGKLLMIFSYREVTREDTVTVLTGSHTAFVDRIAMANSLILPGDQTSSSPLDDSSADKPASTPAETPVDDAKSAPPTQKKPTEQSTIVP
jgi:hypothetical protein